MSKVTKLIERFKNKPSDFSWEELVTMLFRLGFVSEQGSGSRVKFYNKKRDCLIQLHKPHPAKIIKKYIVKEVLLTLEREKLI
ncbi:MAG: type II toxin-antitoxin system HicA family toxin [Gammaproteobacteria bacterium]|nr:type II toxin-antitoxin system HicA family toxin [Gammaproteobacteria bacterium]